MSLQDELDAIRNDFEPRMPAESATRHACFYRCAYRLWPGGSYTHRPDPSELLPTLERMKAERAM